MPDLELQIEETAVQLTQQDLDTLSAYSWDMTGYTSRFGFFYLGNENTDVEGLTKWQAEHIFQLTPVPPGMEDELQNMEKTKRINKEKKREILKKNEAVGDAYLTKSVEEKNLLYLSFFLHAYESRINGKVYSFLRRNGMDTYNPARFLDMKLALQEVLLKKLPTYDPCKGAKFLTYMYEFIEDAFLSFRILAGNIGTAHITAHEDHHIGNWNIGQQLVVLGQLHVDAMHLLHQPYSIGIDMILQRRAGRIAVEHISCQLLAQCFRNLAAAGVMDTDESYLGIAHAVQLRLVGFIIVVDVHSSIIAKVMDGSHRAVALTAMASMHTAHAVDHFGHSGVRIRFIYTVLAHIVAGHAAHALVIVDNRIPTLAHAKILLRIPACAAASPLRQLSVPCPWKLHFR